MALQTREVPVAMEAEQHMYSFLQSQSDVLPNLVREEHNKLTHELLSLAEKEGTLSHVLEGRGLSEYYRRVGTMETLHGLHDELRRLLQLFFQDRQFTKVYNVSVMQVLHYIHRHYSDENLSVKKLAEQVFLTPTYLSNLFKQEVGKTIGQYITEVRIERSKELLRDKRFKLYHVAQQVGYSDSNYYAKAFKKQTRVHPLRNTGRNGCEKGTFFFSQGYPSHAVSQPSAGHLRGRHFVGHDGAHSGSRCAGAEYQRKNRFRIRPNSPFPQTYEYLSYKVETVLTAAQTVESNQVVQNILLENYTKDKTHDKRQQYLDMCELEDTLRAIGSANGLYVCTLYVEDNLFYSQQDYYFSSLEDLKGNIEYAALFDGTNTGLWTSPRETLNPTNYQYETIISYYKPIISEYLNTQIGVQRVSMAASEFSSVLEDALPVQNGLFVYC